MALFRPSPILGLGVLFLSLGPCLRAEDPPPSRVVVLGKDDWKLKILDWAAPVGNLKIYNQDMTGGKLAELSNRYTNGTFTLAAGKTYDIIIIPSPKGQLAGLNAIALTFGFEKAGTVKEQLNVKEVIMEDVKTSHILESIPSDTFRNIKDKVFGLLKSLGVDRDVVDKLDIKTFLKPIFKLDPKTAPPEVKVDLGGYQKAKDGIVFVTLN